MKGSSESLGSSHILRVDVPKEVDSMVVEE